MAAYLVDNPPRIRQFRPRRAALWPVIGVHTAESFPDETGPDTGAENVADFIRRRTNYGSYHCLSDSDSRIKLVEFDQAAYHIGTHGLNDRTIGISAATQAAKWNDLDDEYADAMVRNMARDAADAARYVKAATGKTVPARRITLTRALNGYAGFLAHGDADPDRRTDPGRTFPWSTFLAYFDAEMSGTPTPPPEDDMPLNAADKEWIRYTMRAVFAEKARISEWAESLLGPPGARSRDGLIGYAAGIAMDTRRRVAAIEAAITAIPGVDGAKLAADVAAAVQRIDADSIVDELSDRLSDDDTTQG